MPFNAFERLFVVVLLLLSMQVEIGLTRPYEMETDPGSISAPVHVADVAIESSLDFLGAFLILRRWRPVLRALRAVWPLVGLAVLAVASTAWSVRPTLTLRRSALLVVSMMFAIYVGERYSLQKQIRLLTHIFCTMMVAIVILRGVAPRYVVDYVSHPGAWKGLSAYKNAFGQYMAIAVLVLLLVRFHNFRWLKYVFLVMAAGLLRLSQSAASLLCCVMVVAAIPVWRSSHVKDRQRLAVYSIVAILLVVTMYLFATHSGRVFYQLGRNSSLTGRTQLWPAVYDTILRRPVLGYGYDAFWASLTGEGVDVRRRAGWAAQRSDNGFLDLGLSLGVVGVCLFFFVFALSFRRAIAYLKYERQPFGLWPIAYLCFYLVHNLAESTLLTRGTLPDLIFIMITTSLALDPRLASVPNAAPSTFGAYGLAVPRRSEASG